MLYFRQKKNLHGWYQPVYTRGVTHRQPEGRLGRPAPMAIEISKDIWVWADEHNFIVGVKRAKKDATRTTKLEAAGKVNMRMYYYPTLQQAVEGVTKKILMDHPKLKMSETHANELSELIKVINKMTNDLAKIIPTITLKDVLNKKV